MKTVKLLLKESVKNVGRVGDVVEVSDGYARNYLLPRNLALPVNEGNKRQIERERKIFETKEAEEKQQAEAVAAWLREAGESADRYHGRLKAAERHDIQERFMRGELTAIVATPVQPNNQ